MSAAVDLSIITVGFKSREYVRALLESLFASRENMERANLTIEHFIIDNASGDGLIDMVKKEFVPHCDERLTFVPIQNEMNFGFAKANNIGIRRARGRYVLLLNPDMRLKTDSLINLVAWMDSHQDAAISGGKLVNENNEIVPHVRRFPTLLDQTMILLKIPHLFPRVLDKYLAKDFNYEAASPVDSIRGSFFAIRRETIEKIGALDERYFIWFEEVDYCRMANEAGLQVWYTPSVTTVDFVGRSFALVGGLQKQKYFTDSMTKYFQKWNPKLAWIIRTLKPFALAIAWIAEK